MPPFLNTFIPRADFQLGDASKEFLKQWKHPSDVFSVLLILGGDVVARALAQSTGWPVGLPSFSFGWVAYSINSLVAAVGENKLMPEADYRCLVINGRSGYARDNKSWIIGRMARDYDFWMNQKSRDTVEKLRADKMKALQTDRGEKVKEIQEAVKAGDPEPELPPVPGLPAQAGLCVSIYRPSAEKGFAKPADWMLVFQSIAVAILQLAVAAIPCGIWGDWSILMITVCGILLSSLTASLTQWRDEKWAGRRQERDKEQTYIVTRGNGSQHAIVILGCANFLNLEDLASCQTDVAFFTSWLTRLALGTLAFFWILLLITASSLDANTWFLLAVGGIGILFNIYVAGTQKFPHNNGIPIECVDVIGHHKVMEALLMVERSYSHVGKSMLDTFFPGELKQKEIDAWTDIRVKREAATDAQKAAKIAPKVVDGVQNQTPGNDQHKTAANDHHKTTANT